MKLKKKLNVLIAPDSFKGTFSARQIAGFIAKGVRKTLPNARIKIIPMADGGEGTIDAVASTLNGKIITKIPTLMRARLSFILYKYSRTFMVEQQ